MHEIIHYFCVFRSFNIHLFSSFLASLGHSIKRNAFDCIPTHTIESKIKTSFIFFAHIFDFHGFVFMCRIEWTTGTTTTKTILSMSRFIMSVRFRSRILLWYTILSVHTKREEKTMKSIVLGFFQQIASLRMIMKIQ